MSNVSMIDGHIDPDRKKMTFENVKRIRENPTAKDVDNKELHRIIDIAVEKQIPKKTIDKEYVPNGNLVYGHCPVCDTFTNNCKACCNKCGQRLDWSDTE
jgi:hypothetical protein